MQGSHGCVYSSATIFVKSRNRYPIRFTEASPSFLLPPHSRQANLNILSTSRQTKLTLPNLIILQTCLIIIHRHYPEPPKSIVSPYPRRASTSSS